MALIRGYSDFLKSVNEKPTLKHGLVLDTNILVSATYEPDPAYREATELYDYLIELGIPTFCNVNVRAEFLEIHRRIIFTEALLNFRTENLDSAAADNLNRKLHSLKTRTAKAEKNDSTFRLSDREIKDFKVLISKIEDRSRNAWLAFCNESIGTKLSDLWSKTEAATGLQFLSLRRDDHKNYIDTSPDWDEVAKLMEQYGLSSSDAMIMNIFLCSKFVGLVSSDIDIALSFKEMPDTGDKILFIPDRAVRYL